MSPAVLNTLLAGLNVDRGLREAITGDLIEEHAGVAAEEGERSANRWLRQQVLGSVPVFVAAAIRRGGFRWLMAVVGAAVAALLVTVVLIGVSTRLWYALSPEYVRELMIVALTVDVGFGVAGGYLAARFGRVAPLGAALVFGIISVLLTTILGAEMSGGHRLLLSLLLIPATLSGGWLRARRLVHNLQPVSSA